MICPVCKAENTQGPACRRCKADLSLLWSLESRREALLNAARQYLALAKQSFGGDDATPVARLQRRWACRQATAAATAAARLRAGADAGELIALARLLGRDFAGAYRAYRAFKDVPGGEKVETAAGADSAP
jgi:hypothetical protein